MGNQLSDYTEGEFLELLRKIFNAEYPTANEYDEAVDHVVKLIGHPTGTDIIFYPSSEAEDSPEGVLKVVKEWRATNGLPGFRE
ncbi:MAG: bacteriocin immunity protein [Pseudomonas indica]|nr:bacteriocin immunity protein [Pseudomonas indica]